MCIRLTMGTKLIGWSVTLLISMLAISKSMAIAVKPSTSPLWCVMIDYVLKGYEDTITQNKTQKLCHNACKDWSWCESSNYNMASGQCQLLNGSHYGDSRSLVSSKAWVYSYTCSKVRHISLDSTAS